ncbi:MAG: tetratricopeptide repeat protein [Candidatus Omnitrophica bacterium]|nr:tetratricopeptide repeat protein [Candidatus Omnitrophota bacterium]
MFYNTYLVDRSVVNLKFALKQLALAKTPDDLQKIKPFLRVVILKEISKKTLSGTALASLESALNIIDNLKTMAQVEDIKFSLKSLLDSEEKSRGAFLSAVDNLSSRIIAPTKEASRGGLEANAGNLLVRINSTQDKTLKQGYYYDLGNIYTQLEDIDRAEKAFLEAINIDPSTDIALKAKFNLAWAYKSVKKYEKALVYFKQIIQEASAKDIPLISQFQVADTLFKKGEFKAAAEVYAQLSSESPKFSIADLALYEAGYISYYYLNDREAAFGYLSKLEEKFPSAKIVEHELTQLRPVMAQEFTRQGYMLLREKKYSEALEIFKTASNISSSNCRILCGMGLSYYWLNLKAMAVESAKKSINASPCDDEAVAINALFVLINSGLHDDAIKIGEDLARKNVIKRAEFHYNLGYAYIYKAKIQDAQSSFGRTVKINPDFLYAYNNMGCAYWAVKNYSEAINKFKLAIALDPKYLDAHFNLGISYYYTNRFDEAYAEFKLVADADPNYKDIQSYLKRATQALNYQP